MLFYQYYTGVPTRNKKLSFRPKLTIKKKHALLGFIEKHRNIFANTKRGLFKRLTIHEKWYDLSSLMSQNYDDSRPIEEWQAVCVMA